MVLRFDLNAGDLARVVAKAQSQLIIRRDHVVQTERVECRSIGDWKYRLQTAQRAEGDRLTLAVDGSERNRSATQEEPAPDHRTRSKRGAGCDQWVESVQRGAATTRSKIGIPDTELGRATAETEQAINVRGLLRRDVAECLRRKTRSKRRQRHRRSQTLRHVTREET